MKKLALLTILVSCTTAPSWAQLYPPNEAGVSLGAWHTIVKDVDTTRKRWELWGGKPMKIDGVDVMKFRGVFIFMIKGQPKAPSIDSFIDHIAFQFPDAFPTMKKLTDNGVKTDKINLATMRGPNWTPKSDQRTWTYTYSPDGLRVEVETNEGESAATVQESSTPDFNKGMSSDMIHMYFKDLDAMRTSYKFYKTYFGGVTLPDANINLHIPGTKINFATDNGQERGSNTDPFIKDGTLAPRAKGTPRPTGRGGALDYIGFEVTNLPAFVKKLEAAGVKFDEPYSKTRHKGYASAMFTGPGGEVVELTEGLRKF